MWRLYAIGFAVMSALMVAAGVTLFFVTLAGPASDTTADSEAGLLIRAGVAVVLGILAAILSTLAWRQSRKPAV